MNTQYLKELREFMADYQPNLMWPEWQLFSPEYGGDRSGWSKEAAQALIDKIKKYRGEDPRKAAVDWYVGWQSSWSKDQKKLEKIEKELREVPSKTPVGTENEVFYFQCGTSRTRAEHFLKNGLGFVRLERMVGDQTDSLVERTFGLQVSEVCGSCRSGFDRLCYYAGRQSDFNAEDEAVVLIGKIKKNFVYDENNAGEFAISCKNYSEIFEAEILSLSEYSERFCK